MIILAAVATSISFILVVTKELYFAIRFAECKNCGWITKNAVGRCNGCGGKRRFMA